MKKDQSKRNAHSGVKHTVHHRATALNKDLHEQQNEEAGNDTEYSFEETGKKVIDFMKAEVEKIDKETILKVAAVAIVGIYALRRGGVVGSLLLSAATGVVTKYLAQEVEEMNAA